MARKLMVILPARIIKRFRTDRYITIVNLESKLEFSHENVSDDIKPVVNSKD